MHPDAVIAYCTGLIVACTVLLAALTALTLKNYNMLREITHGAAGAHDEEQLRRAKGAVPAQPPAAVVSDPAIQRVRHAVRASAPPPAPPPPEPPLPEPPAPAPPRPPAPRSRKAKSTPVERFDSGDSRESALGATEWTGPVTTYIPADRLPKKPAPNPST